MLGYLINLEAYTTEKTTDTYVIFNFRFLRSVSYREFSQLIYGFLGADRIPLPACAYHAIRLKFKDENNQFVGFDDPSQN